MKSLPKLSTSQQEIMEIIWDHEEISVTEVQQILQKRRRKVARNTVQTLLVRMEEKGWLAHRTVGRTFFYRAAQPRKASLRMEVSKLLDNCFQGSAESLVSSLLETCKLKKGEADRIRKLLDDAEKKPGKRN